jgi:alpha-tubulin suppressor-like RCC1 family protein
MVGLSAPARRMGLFLGDTSATVLTAEGWALFDAAVQWGIEATLPQVATPTLAPGDGTYAPGQSVVVSVATSGAVIRYTLSGAVPAAGDPTLASGGSVPLGNFTFKAKAWKLGHLPSAVATGTYALNGPVAQRDVAAGWYHSLALKSDGTVWSWGNNGDGQLGIPGFASIPRIVSGLSGATGIAAGGSHSLALRGGTVWSWGANTYGQLGDNTTTAHTIPAPVGGLSNVTAMAAGSTHSLALNANGTVMAWGSNAEGQLGTGLPASSLVPVAVANLTGVVAIAAGDHHSLALTSGGRVWAWGANNAGQIGNGGTSPPVTSPVEIGTLEDIVAIAAGSGIDHNLAVGADGRVWAWGNNSYGQTGQSGPPYLTAPSLVNAPPDAVRVSAGSIHSITVRQDGTLLSFGNNQYDQLGRWTSYPPVNPDAGPVDEVTGAVKVAAGSLHNLALAGDGSIWVWGDNSAQQLGDGTSQQRGTPVKIAAAGMDWTVSMPQFSPPGGTSNSELSVTLTSATPGATIHYNQTGNPTTSDPSVPSGGSFPVTQSAQYFARAFKPGWAPSGIAYTSYVLQVLPLVANPTSGVFTTPVSVTLTCATPGVTIHYTTNGPWPDETSPVYTGPINVNTSTTLRAVALRAGWGESSIAETYTMNFGTLSPPTISPAPGTYTSRVDVTLSAAAGTTIRYTTDGSEPTAFSTEYTGPVPIAATSTVKAKAFHPDYTESATASASYTIEVATPVFAPDGGTYPVGQAVAVTAATPGSTIHYTLNGAVPTETDPVIASGTVLGLTSTVTLKAKAFKAGCVPSGVKSATYTINGQAVGGGIAAGSNHSLAATAAGSAWSWGRNWSGQLGDGTQTDRVLPTVVPGVADVTAVAGGYLHSLALTSGGTVWAWGSDSNGQLGNGPAGASSTPVQVTGLTGVIAIDAGEFFSLALKADGTVWAWGANFAGQLGIDDPTTQFSLQPVQVVGLDGVVALAAGSAHALAVRSDGTVWAWGQNGLGQLGINSTVNQFRPVVIPGLAGASGVAAGYWHSLALLGNGQVRAWGANHAGQLGDSSSTSRPVPVPVSGLDSVRAIGTGDTHSLAIRTDGSLWSWGANDHGQLGNGSMVRSTVPVMVPGVVGATAAAGGNMHTVVLLYDGRVLAFGDGGIGDGTTAMRLSAVPLSAPNYDWLAGTPVLTPDAGTYSPEDVLAVTMTSASTGALIHYTLDGSEPSTNSPSVASGGQVDVVVSSTLKARAWPATGQPSNRVAVPYVLRLAPPTVTPPGGVYMVGQPIGVVTPTIGVTMHYRTDGMAPEETDPSVASGESLPLNDPMSLLVKGWKSGWEPSDLAGGYYTPKAPAPTLNPPGGTYNGQAQVVLTTTVSGPIHYTTDGRLPLNSDPSVSSGQSVTLTASGTLKARALPYAWALGDVAAGSYQVHLGTAEAPTFTPPAGSYSDVQMIAVASATPGATVRYTLDGSNPTLSSPVYETPVPVDASMTIRARAFKADWIASATAAATYTINLARVATPTFGTMPGRYTIRKEISIACATPGAEVRYTTSGLDPTEGDPLVPANGIVVVDRPTRLKARGFKAGLDASDIRRADYWITGALAGGGAHTLALDANGVVWSWGGNARGQLGNGTDQPHTPPAQVSGLPIVRDIAAGADFSLALAEDGTLWAWGANDAGQLGIGGTNDAWTPTLVSGVSGVAAIAAGANHSLVVKTDGTIWAWGANDTFQLARTDPAPSTVPIEITALSGIAQVAAGSGFSAVLKTDGAATGAVWAWGRNDYGQLGNSLRTTPTHVPARGVEGAVQISAGDEHGLALRSDGHLWAWGSGRAYQLGHGIVFGQPGWDGPGPNETQAVTDAVLAVAGGRRSFAVTRPPLGAFGLWAWGLNTGQIGDGTTSSYRLYPAPTLLRDGLRVGAGTSHTLGVRTDGTVWSWGLNSDGQLGVDTGAASTAPAPVQIPGFTLFASGSFSADPDGDGLTTWDEWALGTDPFNADTNGDGVLDGVAVRNGISATDMDMDDDGRLNAAELATGTDPFSADTDGDGVNDGTDAFPLDPTRRVPPQPNPGDTTPPVITLVEPTTAIPR